MALAVAGVVAVLPPAHAEKRHIVITAVEPKGGTTVDKEPFPAGALPQGPVRPEELDQTRPLEVSVYARAAPDPRHRAAMALEFVGINGASHPTTIQGYGKSFELKRGEVTKVALTADKVGIFPIVCATHHPTMVAELIVTPKR
jgi:hypothetical protein